MNQCSIDGCDGKYEAKGFCNKHYLKYWMHGDPLHGREYSKRGFGTVSKSNGYKLIVSNREQKLEHRAIAERAIGKPLPKGAEVHHVDGDKLNNAPDNLVICPSNSYHQLLHRRQEAVAACGNANYRKCSYCQQYDDPANMTIKRYGGFHNACRSKHRREQDAIKRINQAKE